VRFDGTGLRDDGVSCYWEITQCVEDLVAYVSGMGIYRVYGPVGVDIYGNCYSRVRVYFDGAGIKLTNTPSIPCT